LPIRWSSIGRKVSYNPVHAAACYKVAQPANGAGIGATG